MGFAGLQTLGWLLAGVSYLVQGTGLVQAATPAPSSTQSHPSELSLTRRQQILRHAQKFTVKIETPDNQGSGVIVQQQRGLYSVITNEHVVFDSDRITIQTYDGKSHSATRHPNSNFGTKDLVLLEFQSDRIRYPVAVLKPGLDGTRGSSVFAAGFPHQSRGTSFKATQGKISHITHKSLNGGYQIGYSNWVPKGMSGGPVLNRQGHVIAINGLHAEPLWGNPYVWDDGTIPPDTLFPLFSNLSWAIPAESVIESLPSTVSCPHLGYKQ